MLKAERTIRLSSQAGWTVDDDAVALAEHTCCTALPRPPERGSGCTGGTARMESAIVPRHVRNIRSTVVGRGRYPHT